MFLIYNDQCYYNGVHVKGYVSREVISFDKLDLSITSKTFIHDPVILFQNRYDGNFRHFMTETFHLLSLLYRPNIDRSNIKIMVDKNLTYNYSYQVLELLNLTDNIIYKEPDHIYEVNKLLVSRPRLFNPNDPYYRSLLKDLILKAKEKSTITSFNEKVYLSREHIDLFTETHTPKRWVTNLNDVTKILYEKGFVKTQVDDLDFWDQISIINNAKHIVTLIGANCDNIAFMDTSSKFSIIHAPNQAWWVDSYSWIGPVLSAACFLVKDTTVEYNPTWGSEDQLNGPYKADINAITKLS